MTPEPKHQFSREEENSVDVQIGEELFSSAIEVLQNTASLQELFKSFPEGNPSMKPIEFTQNGWEYQISVSKIDRKLVKEKVVHIRRQQESKIEEINIKKNYEDLNDSSPKHINCTYEYFSPYEPPKRIYVRGPISIDFIRDFIDDLCF